MSLLRKKEQIKSDVIGVLLFYDDGVVEQRDYFGQKLSNAKPITKDLVTMLSRAFFIKDGHYSFKGFIPENIKYVKQDPELTVIWTVKAGVHKLLHTDKKYEGKYYLPNLCFVLSGDSLRIFSYRSWAPNSNLYTVSFPNMFGNNDLCKGTAKLNLDKCDYWEEIVRNGNNVFFNSRFSHSIKTNDFKILKGLDKPDDSVNELLFSKKRIYCKIHELL